MSTLKLYMTERMTRENDGGAVDISQRTVALAGQPRGNTYWCFRAGAFSAGRSYANGYTPYEGE